MSNYGLEVMLKKQGLVLERADVGDRYVVEKMIAGGYNVGGEQSGHLLFLDHATTGDGLISALKVLEVMLTTGKRLSELAKIFERYPQVLISKKVRENFPSKTRNIPAARLIASSRTGRKGRVNVRYSGTSALRVMVEGEDEGKVRSYAEQIIAAAREDDLLA